MNKTPYYFPLANGRYDVRPGLFSLKTDFGNGRQDRLTFQIDVNYRKYILNKFHALKENRQKYFCTARPSPSCLQQVCIYIAQQLSNDLPEYFWLEENKGQSILHCDVETGQNESDIYIPATSTNTDPQKLLSTINELMLQVQDDIAIIEINDKGYDHISLLHLCSPNHWSAEDKIGNSFIEAHAPVPEMDSIYKRNKQLLGALINKGPFVRFAWGLSDNKQLNQHPAPVKGNDHCSRQNRIFNTGNPQLFLRVERQVTTGFPDTNCFLFTIRTYLYDIKELKKDELKCSSLVAAIQSMSDATLKYKGLHDSRDDIIGWLTQD